MKKTILKRALSSVISISMLLTTVVQSIVFAADREITTTLGDVDYVVGEVNDFTVTLVEGAERAGTIVIGKFVIDSETAVSTIQYEETYPGLEGWYDLPTETDADTMSGYFGPTTGYPLPDTKAVSSFKVEFAEAGIYNVELSLVEKEDESNVIAQESVEIKVYAEETDYTVLDNALAAVPSNLSVYSATSAMAVKDAQEAAEDFDRNSLTATQAEIDALADNLNTAIEKLVALKEVAFTATAVSTDVEASKGAADQIVLVFGEPTSGYDIIDELTVAGENLGDSTAEWDATNSIYTIVLDSDIDLKNGAKISFAECDDFTTLTGEVIVADDVEVKGNLEGAAELLAANMMTATVVKGSEKPYVATGDKVVIVFNAPVEEDAITIETATDSYTATVVNGTENTVFEIIVADGDNLENGVVLNYGEIKTALGGSFGESIVPAVLRAVISDEDGTALTKGDKIYVIFSTVTNKVADTKETFTTGVLDGATGIWTDSQTLMITLGEGKISAKDTIDLSELNIMDEFGMEAATGTDAITLEGSFGVAIQPALLSLTAISKKGTGAASEGDEIHLAFNVKMREDALVLKNFEFKDGDYGSNTASVKWAEGTEYTDYSTIIITLGENPKVIPGTTKITVSKDLYEITGNKSCIENNLENRLVAGTFGTTIAPSLINATIVKTVPQAGSQQGDEIVLLFSAPTNGCEMEGLISVSGKSLGTGFDAKWDSSKSVCTITLGANPTVNNGDSITLSNDGTLKDINGQKKAISTSIALVGSFGEKTESVGINPTAVTATIVKKTTTPGAQAGDQIVFVFNAATNGPTDLATYLKNTGNFGDIPNGGWSNGNTVYTVTLGTNPSIKDGDSVLFTEGAGIKDSAEINNAISLTTGKLIGSFGAEITPVTAAPKLLGAVIVKNGDTVGAQAGDKIQFIFNMAINNADLLTAMGGKKVFGTDATAELNNNIYTITLGTGASIQDGTVLNILSDAGLKDKLGYSEVATIANITLTGSFGVEVTPVSAAPKLLSAIIVKNGDTVGAQAGDMVHFVFNMAINNADLMTAMGGKNVFGTSASAELDNNIYTVTLGTGATIVDSTVLNILAGAGLKDKLGYSNAATITNITLTGSFGKEVTPVTAAPKLLNAIIVKNGDTVGAQAGDKIHFVFNMAINDVDLLTAMGGKNVFGNNASAVLDRSIYTITLGTGATIKDDSVLNILEDAGLKDKSGYSEVAVITNITLTGSFGAEVTPVSAAPKLLGAVIVKKGDTVGAQAGDKIQFIFNMAINNVDLLTAMGGKTMFGNGATAELVNNIYTITLGTGAKITEQTKLKIDSDAGLKDKMEYSVSAVVSEILLIGSFGVEVTPITAAPKLLSAIIVKGSDVAGANQGDKIHFIFNMAINEANLLTAMGGSEMFGAGATAELNNNMYTITIGTGAKIHDRSELKIGSDAGLKDKMEYSAAAIEAKILLTGSFGTEVDPVGVTPRILRVDIVKASNLMGPQMGDQLRFIFNIKTNGKKNQINLINFIRDSLNADQENFLGDGVEGDWESDGVYVITLGKNAKISDHTKLIISSDARLMDYEEIATAEAIEIEKLSGSFGESVAPKAFSAIAFSKDGKDYIEIEFNVATNKPDETDNLSLFKNASILGVGYDIAWNEAGTLLTITLGKNFTVKNGDILDIEYKKINSADGNIVMSSVDRYVTVQGELRKPVVLNVVAKPIGENGTIVITFSSKTNGIEPNLAMQSSLLGVGATGVWNEEKTELTITLGAGRTITVNSGYVLLNGLGINNGFDSNEIIGQYPISEGTLPEDELLLVDARVNAREDGNYLTVSFNAPTNMYGKKISEEWFALSDVSTNITASHEFGTDATARWESATRLVIKLGAGNTFAEEKNLAADATVAFKNLKFANGLGLIAEKAEKITGSFDGREIALNELTVAKTDNTIDVKVIVDKQELEFNDAAVVTFVLWDIDKTVVSDMNAVKVDMSVVGQIEVSSKFAETGYSKIEVYVTDKYIDTIGAETSFNILADTVTK